MAGVVAGLVVLSTSISYPALIFTGAFEPYLGIGIQMALLGTAVLGLAAAVGSSYPAAIANIQIETAVVLGILSAAIAGSLGERGAGAPALATLVAAIVLSSLSLGVIFMAFGVLRLGNVIRYIPFYARLDAVRASGSGTSYASTVLRPPAAGGSWRGHPSGPSPGYLSSARPIGFCNACPPD